MTTPNVLTAREWFKNMSFVHRERTESEIERYAEYYAQTLAHQAPQFRPESECRDGQPWLVEFERNKAHYAGHPYSYYVACWDGEDWVAQDSRAKNCFITAVRATAYTPTPHGQQEGEG